MYRKVYAVAKLIPHAKSFVERTQLWLLSAKVERPVSAPCIIHSLARNETSLCRNPSATGKGASMFRGSMFPDGRPHEYCPRSMLLSIDDATTVSMHENARWSPTPESSNAATPPSCRHRRHQYRTADNSSNTNTIYYFCWEEDTFSGTYKYTVGLTEKA